MQAYKRHFPMATIYRINPASFLSTLMVMAIVKIFIVD
jgi:hypothetical protein